MADNKLAQSRVRADQAHLKVLQILERTNNPPKHARRQRLRAFIARLRPGLQMAKPQGREALQATELGQRTHAYADCYEPKR
jgi:hypothetical protein